MKYTEINIKGSKRWIADPKNWEELSFTIHKEARMLTYNPNDHEVDPTLINIFL